MALDQIPSTGREVRFKIMRNIGNSFVRLGQFQVASPNPNPNPNPNHFQVALAS